MAVRMAQIAYDEDPEALYRGRPPRVPRVRAIAPTARLLAPTQASLANARAKALTAEEKATAERRAEQRRRVRLARVAKANGRLTVPRSPKFHAHPRARTSKAAQLTMTSRELMEIEAIRKRVNVMRKKTRRYHEATTRVLPGVASAALTTKENASFAKALRACGGMGVPAVRRAKLTTPVGFDLAIDRRIEARKRHSVAVDEEDKADENPAKRQRSL